MRRNARFGNYIDLRWLDRSGCWPWRVWLAVLSGRARRGGFGNDFTLVFTVSRYFNRARF